jgi:hypothetical protein
MSFGALHIRNAREDGMVIPLCGNGGFDRDLLVSEDTFISNPDDWPRCWECGSYIDINTIDKETA